MNNLKKIRLERGETLKYLERVTGIDNSLLSKYENGLRRFSQDNIKILCEHFNVTSDYLLGYSQDEQELNKLTEVQELYSKLTEEDKQYILKQMKLLYPTEKTIKNEEAFLNVSSQGKKQ